MFEHDKTHYEVIIIGSGFGGQLAAINLKRLGIESFLILERRSYMGGTWSENTYPGAAVDVHSPLYSISFEPYDWSQMFADRQELNDYTDYVIAKHGLEQHTRTNTNVGCIEWIDSTQSWTVRLEKGTSYTARFVINATGPLSTPVVPEFKGRASFAGPSFHTSQWDASADYKGKRVAIIGSGASAAQVIPAIAPEVEHLHVFQRTPHWVLPRGDYHFKPWQRALLKQKFAYRLLRMAIYWALELRVIGLKYSKSALELMGTKQAMAHLAKQIPDPVLRAKVTPDFTIGCKRVLVSNTLYPTYQRDNVTLHDKTDGIEEITSAGILSKSGEQHDLDMIIYSTGFDATDGVISYPVIGREGRVLADFWHDYPRAYMGTSVPGFPNLFIVTGPNTGIGHTSAIFVIESQMKYIVNALKLARSQGLGAIEVKPEAEAAYTEIIHREMAKTVWQTGGCSSWYKSRSGKVIAMFPGFSFTFRRWASRFRTEDHELVPMNEQANRGLQASA